VSALNEWGSVTGCNFLASGVSPSMAVGTLDRRADAAPLANFGRHTRRTIEFPESVLPAVLCPWYTLYPAGGVAILGDSFFYDSLRIILTEAERHPDWAWVGLKEFPDPGRCGVTELKRNRVISLEEKPARPRSSFAVIGFSIYPSDVFDVIKTLKPSARGDLVCAQPPLWAVPAAPASRAA
jgi:hypothetical protein